MNKKWFAMMSALMALVLLFTGLPAMAQADRDEATDVASGPNALVIRAPQVAYVNQEVTIGVFEQNTGAPVGGAFVFALSRDNADAFQAEMATLREDSATEAGDVDYQRLAETYGELIGITGNTGEVYHAFDEAGWYMLLAVKAGYYPGFSPITIRPMVKVLGIKAPQSAKVDEEVTITVFERMTQQPVEGALVFALSRDNAEALQAEMSTLREDATLDTASIDYEELASRYGELVGITNERGEVYHAFGQAGRYLLIAVKPGYLPGFARINILPTVKALGIKAPQNARVGEEVTITVFERMTQQPVEGALVFAVSPDAAEALQAEVSALREDATVDAASIDYEEVARRYGELIGITNERGEVYHAFGQAGRYLLIAVKSGYLPGFARINILPTVKALGIKAPNIADVGEEVTIGVFERGTGVPVENAGVWALSRENAEIVKAEMARMQEETATVDDIDYEALIEVYGEFIGWTNEHGEVNHTFDEAGCYMLVAVKRGYLPGFHLIRIGTVPKALVVSAPKTAQVGETVTIGVSERGTGEVVEGAFVFALSRDNATDLNEEITRLRETGETDAAGIDYRALAEVYGELIGITNERGEVYHAFDETGWYLLLTVKSDYLPGFATIRIGTFPKALGIRAPRVAQTGEEVTIGVFERRTQSPVEGAGVWAVSRENVEILKEQMAQLRDGAVTADAEVDYESLVSLVGVFIGWTDENGEVRHTFEEPGYYLLVAVKRGYYPGFSPISVRSLSVDASRNILQACNVRQVQAVRTNSPQLISVQAQDGTSQSPKLVRKAVAVGPQIQAVNQPVRVQAVERVSIQH